MRMMGIWRCMSSTRRACVRGRYSGAGMLGERGVSVGGIELVSPNHSTIGVFIEGNDWYD